MYSFVFAVLAVSAYCHNALCETTPTTEGFALLQSTVAPEDTKTKNHVLLSINTPRNILWPRQEHPQKVEYRSLEKGKRKSRILGSLAFLAGLGVGGLAGAASTGVKHLAKYPEASLTLNLGGPKVTPYFAQLYEPYAYVPHPYIYPPYPLYPFLDPLRVQNTIGSAQNSLQHQLQSQSVNQVDVNSQNETSDNEKYEEDKTVENESSEVVDDKKSNGEAELQAETDRNAEEKETGITCNIQNIQHTTDNAVDDAELEGDLQQEADDSIGVSNRQVQHSTTTHRPHHHNHHHNKTAGQNVTVRPTTHHNATMQPTPYPRPTLPPLTPFPMPPQTTPPFTTTTNLPFFGYYGGNPQEIDHVHLTTDNSIFKPADYPSADFNLPFDRPANFVPEEKFNYLINSNPSISPYYPHQYSGPNQEHEYYNSNYYKLMNPPDNTQTFSNGFRPIL